LTTLVWKDRQEVYMLTNMDPPPAEGDFLWRQQPPLCYLTSWNGMTGTWVTSTVLIIWLTAIRWVNVPSTGPRNYFSTFWI
jgi:hypothetical protein